MDRVTGSSRVWIGLLIGMAAVIAFVLMLGLVSDDEPTSSTGSPGGSLPPGDALGPESPDGNDGVTVDSCNSPERVSWIDAVDHINTRIALVGPVTDIRQDDEGRTELIVGQEANEAEPVALVLTQNFVGRSPAPPEELYGDETVCAIGVVQRIDGQLQIVLNRPTDIGTV